ncbi:hypothetical protein AGLY_017139 [Aphis glycines]|uniref:Uncharacterized protein n=1 Tax=Aphis glycines TaxID=307491 RepID=A0A6G0SWE4_APHGL|nr:hypothetical protein AGLY_017139 [Aphis glycines]
MHLRCYCTFSNSCPNLQQQQQGHLVSPRRRQLDVNKRRTTIYKGARRPATADVPKLSTTEHFHDTQPLILHISLLSLIFVQNNHLDLNLILARNRVKNYWIKFKFFKLMVDVEIRKNYKLDSICTLYSNQHSRLINLQLLKLGSAGSRIAITIGLLASYYNRLLGHIVTNSIIFNDNGGMKLTAPLKIKLFPFKNNLCGISERVRETSNSGLLPFLSIPITVSRPEINLHFETIPPVASIEYKFFSILLLITFVMNNMFGADGTL